MSPPQDIGDQALLGAVGAGGVGWEETFDFTSSSGWTISGSVGGTITVNSTVANKLSFVNVDQPSNAYATKLFSNGELDDCMFTLLADDVTWISGDPVPSPLYFGAGNANLDMKDANAVSFAGCMMTGCGGINYGDHGTVKDEAVAFNYSACWIGNGTGTDDWLTFYRTSSTGARVICYPDSSKSSSDFDDAWLISSGTSGLDRVLATAQNDGPSGRRSTGTVGQMTFKNEVNEE